MDNKPWACMACTFENQAGHLACAICGTERPHKHNIVETEVHHAKKQQKPIVSRSAPPESFAAKASKATASSNAPVMTEVKSAPHVAPKAPSSLHGQPFEARELKPGEKALGLFHIVVKNCSGFTSALEMAVILGQIVQPFSLKRVLTSYYTLDGLELNVHSQSSTSKDISVKTRAFVEFYPHKGLLEKLRSLIGRCKDSLQFHSSKDLELAGPFGHAFIVPYFDDSKAKRRDGNLVCPNIKMLCKDKNCTYAHEPEDWGVSRVDSANTQPSTVLGSHSNIGGSVDLSIHEAGILDPAALQKQVYEENLRLLAEAEKRKIAKEAESISHSTRSILCNGCGNTSIKSIADKKIAHYCDVCRNKGVPKQECSRCFMQRYASEFSINGLCTICISELSSENSFPVPQVSAHHMRVDFHNNIVLSRTEVLATVQAVLGCSMENLIEVIEEPGSKRPMGCFVRALSWSYEKMAPIIRGAAFERYSINIRVDDSPRQNRIEQLFLLVPESLLLTEFQVLENHYRSLH